MKKKIKGKINLSFELGAPREMKVIKFSFEKLWEEMKEHLPVTLWIFKRIVVPLIPLLIITNFLMNLEFLPVVMLSFIPFLYGNFLPDFDSLIEISRKKRSPFAKKLFLLLFGPVYMYYYVFEDYKPVYSKKKKEFHSMKYFLVYAAFLFLVSMLIFSYTDVYKHVIFAIFGSLGYLIHLIVDRRLSF